MSEDRRLSWLALMVLLAALAISFLVTARLAFLNFFYLPVLLVAYWSGRRTATLIAVLCVLFVAFLAMVYPEQFAAPSGTGLLDSAWLHLFVWGCFLILAGYASGTLIERARDRGKVAGRRPARPEVQLYNIGTLAIIKGYLRHDQVLKILQIQQKNQKLFGEIAVGLRLLTPDQVDELLRMQQEKRSVTSSEIAMAKLELAKAQKASAEPR
ncbi:MAG: hypothetical protein ABR599_01885 [Gemmatimonadota bacterium]